MFLGMQGFGFAPIQSNLSRSRHFCPNFATILFKYTVTKFAQSNQFCPKMFALGCG